MRLLWICLVLGVVLMWASSSEADCIGSGTAWSCAAGTTAAQIQTTLNNAADGATLTFAAGSYTWGDSAFYLINTKGFTLQGAGIDQSVVNVVNNTVCCSNGHFSGINTHLYRITGFTFQNAPAGIIVFAFYGAQGAIATKVRFDHNRFTNFPSNTDAMILGGFLPNSQVYGSVDNNIFDGPVNFTAMKGLGIGTDYNSPTSPYTSSVRGTVTNIFMEDNVLNFASQTGSSFGAGCIDGWNGASIVFRFNYVKNCQVVVHGSIHGGGPLNLEVYGNVLVRDAGSFVPDCYRCIFHQGSMESYWWGNQLVHSGQPISGAALEMTQYRSANPTVAGYSDPPGRCDGTKAWDGNTAGNYGYPCWLQPGRAPAGGSPIWGTLAPIYVWNNIDQSTGNNVPMIVSNNWSATNPAPSDHIKAERDYYNAVSASAQTSSSSPFNGTVGMGFGPLSNRPSTCTHITSPDGDNGGGVGYFATDQGSWNTSTTNPQGVQQNGADGILYRCSATNTWTSHYTPYTYPHPLQAGGGGTTAIPPAPTGLTIK